MKIKHNLRVRPLSVVLMDARLANSKDREKAIELIMIYSSLDTPENISKYFDLGDLEDYVIANYCNGELTIEEVVTLFDKIQWKEEYKSLIYFKNGNNE